MKDANIPEAVIDDTQTLNPARQKVTAVPEGGWRVVDKPNDGYRLSCNYCLHRKQKCSKDHPSCQRCTKDNYECVYILRKRTRPKKIHKQLKRKTTNTTRRRQRPSTTPITTDTPIAIDGERYRLSDEEFTACISLDPKTSK
jgi:hypothetical protein